MELRGRLYDLEDVTYITTIEYHSSLSQSAVENLALKIGNVGRNGTMAVRESDDVRVYLPPQRIKRIEFDVDESQA